MPRSILEPLGRPRGPGRRRRAFALERALSLLVILVLGVGVAIGPVHAGEPSPAEIIERADAAATSKSSHLILTQTIETTGGDQRTFTIESWSKNGNEKSLMRFLSPAPSHGIGMLALENGDNIWAYFPDSDDLRKIASSARNQSMQGSDFSYEDMSAGEYGRRYEAKSAEPDTYDGHPCWKVTLVPKASSPYSKIVVWIDRETYVAYQSHHFDDGEHVKTLTLSNWKKVKGIWTPYVMTMKNLERGSQTVIRVKKLKYDLELDDEKFTTRFLTMI